MTNTVGIDIQIASDFDPLPTQMQLQTWTEAALQHLKNHTEITIRIVDAPEIQALNKNYRHKDKPTNVLSFPMEIPEDIGVNLLGDVVICAPIIWQEAEQQNKDYEAHFAHMVVHGCLHLLGYDHTSPEEAGKMEPLEVELLESLNFSNPYEVKS